MSRSLVNLFTATLDQKKQHNDEERASDYPDNCCIGHVHSPSSLFVKLRERCGDDDDRRA